MDYHIELLEHVTIVFFVENTIMSQEEGQSRRLSSFLSFSRVESVTESVIVRSKIVNVCDPVLVIQGKVFLVCWFKQLTWNSDEDNPYSKYVQNNSGELYINI